MVNLTSGYHPQENGQVERMNQVICTFFQCMLGNQPPLYPWNASLTNSIATSVWSHQHLKQVTANNKCYADHNRSEAPSFRLGDKVWLSTRDIRGFPGCKKLSACYTGPFKILCQINLPCHSCPASSFHISQVKAITPRAYRHGMSP